MFIITINKEIAVIAAITMHRAKLVKKLYGLHGTVTVMPHGLDVSQLRCYDESVIGTTKENLRANGASRDAVRSVGVL